VAWKRAHDATRINRLVKFTRSGAGRPPDVDLAAEVPPVPDDLDEQILDRFGADPTQSWDEALWAIAEGTT
jgi:hypothetical protein